MDHFSYSFLYYTKSISLLFASIISVIFWIKQRTKESLLFTCGILLTVLGELKIVFISIGQTFMNDTKAMIEFANTWFPLGNMVSSIGIIITVVGFALVTWKIKGNT